MVTRKILLFCLLLVSAATAFGQETSLLGLNDGPLSISWQEVEGAAAYRVEVRRDGLIFIRTETEANELRLNLAPGEYEYRIGVLTPFGDEAAASPWQSLMVERARTPYFRVMEPAIVWEGDETVELLLDIVDFPDSGDAMNYLLKYQDTKKEVDLKSSGESKSITVNIAGMAPGSWDLEAVAASGLSFVHPGALIIRPTQAPVIESLDTLEVSNTGLVPITVDGSSFDPDMTLAFKGPGGFLEVAAIEVAEGRKAVVYLELDGAKAGTYDLIARNPAGKELRMESALTVTEPEPIVKPKVQPRFELHIGYAPLLIWAPDSFIGGPAVFELAATFHSGWQAPFLRGLGLEARFAGGITVGDDNFINGVRIDYVFLFDASGYWRPLVRGRTAPVILLGFGNMWSGFAAFYGLENMIYIRTGFALDFAKYSNFTRIGLNLHLAFTDNEVLPVVSVMFRRGFRF